MYKCFECEHIFDRGEEKRWVEPHGEEMTGCPICGSAFEETAKCLSCGSEHLGDELYAGRYCLECLLQSISPKRTVLYVSAADVEDDFYAYVYESEFAFVSDDLLSLMRGGFLQRVALDQLKGETKTANRCVDYISVDECSKSNYAEWLKKENYL